jgi:hypothetical protein
VTALTALHRLHAGLKGIGAAAHAKHPPNTCKTPAKRLPITTQTPAKPVKRLPNTCRQMKLLLAIFTHARMLY